MRRLLPSLLAVAAATACAAPAAAAPLGFAPPVYVDTQLAGGEPIMLVDPIHHDIVYTSHEGTTHLYRNGLASQTTFTFLSGYRNQVNIWTSRDGGATWKRNDFGGGFTTNPTQNTGFSDPDLTQDAGGRIYNTGIDLANDSLFSSADGGVTWDRGTPQCHDGDRPWLAGAHPNEVFMATNTSEDALSHRIFQSTDGGQTCSANGIPDSGSMPNGDSYTGDGKILYDAAHDRLVEPVVFQRTDAAGNSVVVGLGVGTWQRGAAEFTPHHAADAAVYAHWPSLAFDDAGGMYLVYDDDPRATGTAGGCGGSATPTPNAIRITYSGDGGVHWTAPFAIAAPAGGRVLWPWAVAGDRGRVNVVWYQTDKVVDLACQAAKLSVMSATLTGADTGAPRVQTADVVGQPISNNNICQSGTTCVATGEDRRLGDFFTNAIDARGCAIVATGDTRSPDPVTGGPRNIALPLFIRQSSGPALRGGGDCSGTDASLGLPSNGGSRGRGGRCASRRHFRIRLRAPRGDRLRRASVYVNGRRVRVLQGRRLRARVDLRGLPKGTVRVKVIASTARGRRLVSFRTYHTCVPKRGRARRR